MVTELAAMDRWVDKLATSTQPNAIRRVGTAAGMAGKKAAIGQVKRTIGGDRILSGDTRFRRLNAGFDVRRANSVDINLRPKGWWVLADSGRKKSGRIESRVGVVKVPGAPRGVREFSMFGPSSGTGVRQKAQRDMERDVPPAAAKAFSREIGRALKGR